MLLQVVLIVCVLIGTLLLVKSCQSLLAICKNNQHLGWRALFALNITFILGYIVFAFQLSQANQLSQYEILITFILLGGGLFVSLIVPLSLTSILMMKQSLQSEQYNAQHDELTGLQNRSSLLQALANNPAEESYALLLIDLNNFKQVNDGLGHYFGDQLLVQVAERLRTGLLEDAQLYRQGGDEFAIILPTSNDEKIVRQIDMLHGALEASIDVTGYPLKTSMSIGVAKYPEHSDEGLSLLKRADLAMYESKQNQTRFEFYQELYAKRSTDQLYMSLRLMDAISNNEFNLNYQPIVCSESGVVVSYEALIRWPQSDGSYINPDEFIPVAEKTTLINNITHWVIRRAALDLNIMRKNGFTGWLNINLSARDLKGDELPNTLGLMVSQGELRPGDVKFEITESAMVVDLANAKKVLLAIKSLGFDFSIDDFGTGFSSLVILRALPVNQIKIDRSFVADYIKNETSNSIVHSIIRLASDIHCTVVAEGVEDRQLATALKHAGCQFQQGYYYSRPLALDSLQFRPDVDTGAR